MEKVVVNLGCGKVRIPGSVGVDRIEIDGCTDKIHDLNVIPYPFDDNSIDEIHFYHVLEHLDQPVQKMEEIWRILKPGGLLHMRVPHFSSMGAFTDITHLRAFGHGSFDCFVAGHYQNFYTQARFAMLKKEIKYFGLYPNDGIYGKYVHPDQCPLIVRPVVRAVNFLIRLSPVLFERIWCYWVGGATEIVFELQKKTL
jgi:SAM-dependent methyltransferase